jgi:dTDP-4-amino-4,6-dideoxygalactose transaminase
MNIPFLKFEKMHSDVQMQLYKAFDDVVKSQWFVMGKKLLQFEEEYASFSNTKFSVGVANGLDALILSLRALEIKKGDEVIVPSNTYIASWLAVSAVGATPIPVEPNINTYNINASLIEEKITSKTKAIMPVHLYGQACEMDEIIAIAKKHNLFVVEDNAQSQGAMCNNTITGSFGNINATSFYPGKNLGALGDAGGITTNDEKLFEKVKVLRNYGSKVKYYNLEKGVNSRLDELQAAMLSAKLPALIGWNNERISIAKKYTEQLRNIVEIEVPQIAANCSSVFHLYVIRTNKRNELQGHLNKAGIGTLIHYPVPPHLQNAYSELGYKKGDFPIAEIIAETALSLPIYPGLTDMEITYVCNNIKNFYL